MRKTLKHLLGPDAPGLSSATFGCLKQDWEQDYQNCHRDLSEKRYVYIWADGVNGNVRMDDRLCLLVIIGSDESERKELLALSDSYRESEASWTEVIMDLKQRGLECAPKLAVGDGVLGLWKLLPNAGLRLLNNVVGCIKPPMYWKNFPKPCSPRSKEHCTISGSRNT